VGYREIYKAVSLTIASQLFNCDLIRYRVSARRLWENILCSALAMESLAQFVGVNPRSAYTAGLMRSLGKVVLDRLAAEALPPVTPYPADSGEPLGEWESRSFGCDNPSVASLLLKEWNFPEDTCAAVLRHYHPESGPVAGQEAFLLNASLRVASELGFELPGESGYGAPTAEKSTLTGLSDGELQLCIEETKAGLESLRQIFSGDLDPAVASVSG
jgi:HD-like signal output (HDOD) protein